MKKLIITADDFGMSKVFNEKILELLDKRFITCTNLMVNRISKDQESQLNRLAKLFKTKPISVGLHCELDDQKEIIPQIQEQYQKFNSIMHFYPTHLDIHKKPTPETITLFNHFAEEHNLPVRNMGVKAKTKQTTNKAFVTKLYTIDEIIEFLNSMKNKESYELVVHPGEFDPNCKSSLNEKRKLDYENIIKIQKILGTHKDIQKVSYAEL